tara:strand:- start:2104 stop:3546 length:1443 start_codon:yes stop_codon:yes gene_type:complete
VIFKNYIDGVFNDAASGDQMDVYEPATGKVYAKVVSSSVVDVDMAVRAADKAFDSWSTLPLAIRCEYLVKIAEAIENKAQHLAELESTDQGKPLSLAARIDIPRAASNFRFFAGAISHHLEQSSTMDNQAINYSLREPVGVAGLISPWNLPLYLLTWKIAPAIACGNTCVAKCSELTPATANALCEIFSEIDLPLGVVNLVHGLGHNVGRAISSHPDIPLVSFTGGTQTAIDIQQQAAPYFKKLSLELGGKNPNIIFADADFELAVEESVRSAFTNQGEICLCGSRILIQESIYEQFREAFVAKTKELVTGDPFCESSDLGALVSASHRDKVLSYIDKAKQLGGRILCGGEIPLLTGPLANGYFILPTVIDGLTQDCDVIQQEIFGPVVTLQSFSSESEALTMANDIAYGLSATIWTKDSTRTHRFAAGLKAGIIWVNTWLKRDLKTPFGGYKASGVGREGGHYSIDFYTESKNVCIALI